MYLLKSKPANPQLFHVAVSLPADLPPSCSPRSSRGYQWIAGINGLQSQEPGIQGQTRAAFALLQSNTWRFFQILFFFFSSSLKKAKGTQTTFTSKPIFNKSCFLRSNTDCIFDMIKGKMIQNSFVQGWLKELSKEKKKILQGLLYLLLKNQKLNWEKHTGGKLLCPLGVFLSPRSVC